MGDGALVEFASVLDALQLRGRDPARNGASATRSLPPTGGLSFGSASTSVTSSPMGATSTAMASTWLRASKPSRRRVASPSRPSFASRSATRPQFRFLDLGERVVKVGDRPLHAFAVDVSPTPGTSPNSPAAGNSIARPLPCYRSLISAAIRIRITFAEGIAEDLITELSKISGLFVAARQSSFALEPGARDPDRCGRPPRGRPRAGRQRPPSRRAASPHGAIGRWRDGRSGLDRALRPHADRHLRRAGRDHAQHCRRARDAAAPSGAAGPGPSADGQHRGLQPLSCAGSTCWASTSGRPTSSRGACSCARSSWTRNSRAPSPGSRSATSTCTCIAVSPIDFDALLATTGRAVALEPTLAGAHAARGCRAGGDRPTRSRPSARSGGRSRSTPIMPALTTSMHGPASSRAAATQAADLLRRAADLAPADVGYPNLLSVLLARPWTACRRHGRGAGVTGQMSAAAGGEARIRARGLYGRPGTGKSWRAGAALEWARRALAVEPDDHMTLYNVACVYAELGSGTTRRSTCSSERCRARRPIARNGCARILTWSRCATIRASWRSLRRLVGTG